MILRPVAFNPREKDAVLRGKGAFVEMQPRRPKRAENEFTFYRASAFPAQYRGGAFIGQHGSWNRQPLNGYRVVFVPFDRLFPTLGDTGLFARGANAVKAGLEIGEQYIIPGFIVWL